MLVDFCAPLINTKGNAQKKNRTSMTLDRFQSLCDLEFSYIPFVGPTAMLVACCGVPIYVTVRVSFKMNLNISCFYSGGQLGQANLSHFPLSNILVVVSCWVSLHGAISILAHVCLSFFALTQSLR